MLQGIKKDKKSLLFFAYNSSVKTTGIMIKETKTKVFRKNMFIHFLLSTFLFLNERLVCLLTAPSFELVMDSDMKLLTLH